MERAVTAPRPKLLEPDRRQIEHFFDALFRHRGTEGFISFRSFYHDDNKPLLIEVKSGFKYLVDVAEDHARRAANEIKPAVFCPPIALFNSRDHAREQDLLAGLVLSIECDERPQQAREKLEAILGPPTAVLYSGGKWQAPDGTVDDKLHLHWRLAALALGDNLAKLKRARSLATRLTVRPSSATPSRPPKKNRRRCHSSTCRIGTTNRCPSRNGRCRIGFRWGKPRCSPARAATARALCNYICVQLTRSASVGSIPCPNPGRQCSLKPKTAKELFTGA
jgi:hypothetical protein